MTTKRHEGGEERPRINSSHEKVKTARGAARASSRPARPGSRAAAPVERVRHPKKTRPAHEPQGDGGGPWSVASDRARETATAVAVAALDKKAVGLEILDVAGKVDYADFLVVMTGRSDRHAQALAQGIEESLKRKGVRPFAVEGLPHGTWVLMDFGDVVVHIFQSDARQLYDIEGLWLDARRLPVPVEPGPPAAD